MAMKLKATLIATGLVVGGLTSYIVVNAAVEGRRDADVFQPHAKSGHYAIDAFMAVVCAGAGFALASCQRSDRHENQGQNGVGERLFSDSRMGSTM